jgi:hypothetical protein
MNSQHVELPTPILPKISKHGERVYKKSSNVKPVRKVTGNRVARIMARRLKHQKKVLLETLIVEELINETND